MTERKLKPLDWHEKDGRHWIAVTATGRVYSISKTNDLLHGHNYRCYINSNPGIISARLSWAMLSCEEDFKNHIESCYE